MSRPPKAAALAALLLLSSILPARAGDPERPIDPVVQEVVRMLDGGVTEPVIAAWLAGSGRRPAHVDGDELVALGKAKASEDLMKRLIRLANEGAAAPAPAPPADRSAAPRATPPPERLAPPPAPAPPSATPTAAPATAADGAVPVRFQLGYRPFTDDESAPRWNLFVYLDGTLLTWARPSPISLTTRSLGFDRSLPAGHHVIRLVQERHEKRFGAWVHEARVAPAALAFDLAPDRPGQPWRVSLQLDQVKISRKGPLALRVTDGDREVAAATGTEEPETWPALCEEVEANVAPGQAPGADARRQLGSCVRWAALWPGVAGVPPRDRVRSELERDLFQPPAPGAAR